LPGYLDHYLARTGYKGQQTDQRETDRENNLWQPIPGDHGSHGKFANSAKNSSPVFIAKKKKGMIIGTLAFLLLGACAFRLYGNKI
jgi:hypothetical protein